MTEFARVEGDEVVVRIPVSALVAAARYSGLAVTNPKAFAPHFALELNAEGMDEELFLNKVMDAACVRAGESAAPGVEFDAHNLERDDG